ncbi:lamin tail domain-containing protein, partial [Pseudomonas sp. CGJS7]|uniref:lamin tail domain-containing protein n=1 Tax=Pseudomonas sp. CGJS7 TaxID=3109348 RepID=UPI00300942E6
MQKLASRALAAGIALALAGAADAQVVVSQIYGGAGTAAIGHNADFIELHNNGDSAVSLNGWSVQYASNGSAWQRTPLSGSIPAGGYYLIRQRSGAGNSSLPAANASGSISMNPNLGKVALVAGSALLTTACPTGLADFVGYGAADCAEGAAPAASAGTTTAQLRKDGGCLDTQRNAADFAVGPSQPRNSASPKKLCAPPAPLPVMTATVSDVLEGDSGFVDAVFKLRLDRPAGPDGVSWSVFTNGGTATAGSDYLYIDKTGFIAPGQSEASFVVQIAGDTVPEADETVTVQVKIASGAVSANGDHLNLQTTILDDDRLPPPILSVLPVAKNEGDEGFTAFEFELQLDRPAGPAGVRWSAFTGVGGSASVDEDYAPIDLSGEIAAGQRSAKFVLPVRGDRRFEGDETVKLQIKAISGAVTANGDYLDTQATIVDDDLRTVPINIVQGRDAVSPLRDQFVAVEGIVTALVEDGFFLQSETSRADADPETSEGVFVQTGAAPSPDWRARRVRVAGTVTELMSPGENPYRESMTAISGSPAVTVLDPTPTWLPAPAAQLLPNYYVGVRGYEQYEGMRVMLPQTRAVGPTGGVTDQRLELTRSDGRFYVVDGGPDRPAPMREPGTRYPALLHGQVQGWLPRWDGNPEAIGVDSAAAGHAPIEIAAGTPIGGLIGPLDQRSGRYTLVLEHDAPVSLPPTQPSVPQAVAAAVPGRRETTVAHYDLGEFFDDFAAPGSNQPASMPFALEQRMGKIARGVVDYLRTPDVVAISGVENEMLLQRLAQRINLLASNSGRADPRYHPILLPNSTPTATVSGFLVRGDEVPNRGARVVVENAQQLGADALGPAPEGGQTVLFDQAPLAIDAVTNYEDGSRFAARIVLVRLQSLDGIDADTAKAERLRQRRWTQADFIAQWAQQHQRSAGALPLLFVGDFQAHAFNDGFVDAIGAIVGKPADPLSTMVPHDGADRVDPDLIDLTAQQPEAERYSSIEQGSRQELQSVLADEALILQTETVQVERVRINADQPAQLRNQPDSALRASVTDPVHVRLVPRAKAALRVWANSAAQRRVGDGMMASFTAQVQNLGPEVAGRVGLGLALSEPVEPLWVDVHAPNWTCEAPVTADGHTSVACSGENVLPQGPAGSPPVQPLQAVTLHMQATPERAGRTFRMAASVTSSAIDPDPSDNAAQTAT